MQEQPFDPTFERSLDPALEQQINSIFEQQYTDQFVKRAVILTETMAKGLNAQLDWLVRQYLTGENKKWKDTLSKEIQKDVNGFVESLLDTLFPYHEKGVTEE